jgi:TetR/AcrR family transcriptional regulator, transcriptional repressor for nem operon
MARPRLHDPDLVLQNAMTVFWQRGFVATAMADIYAATGLKPGNLYATYSDKDTLFRRAFDAYAKQFRATLPQDIAGLPAIVAWLQTQARLATDDPDRKGCLIVNTVTERAAHSPETRAVAQARLDEITDFFRVNLDIAGIKDAEPLAAALTGAVVAIMTLGRAGADAAMIRHVAAQAILSLPPESPKPQVAT